MFCANTATSPRRPITAPVHHPHSAWSVGAVMAMLIGGDNVSPFEAEANLFDGTFSTQAAVGKQIKKVR